jgi:cytochrome c-type biogenesis protein CcmH/NrfG
MRIPKIRLFIQCFEWRNRVWTIFTFGLHKILSIIKVLHCNTFVKNYLSSCRFCSIVKNTMNIYRFFRKLSKILLLILLVCLPLFFLPVTRDFYDTNKWMLFVLTSLLILLMWAGRLVVTGNAGVSASGGTLGLGLLTVASFLSLTFSSFNKMEALLYPMGPVTWISATIILFYGPTLLSAREKILLRLGLAGVAGVAGLFALYQHIGLGSMVFQAGSPFADPFFTPVGTTVGLLTYLILCLPVSLSVAAHAIREKKDAIAAVSVVTAVVTILGIGMTLWKYLPGASSQILPFFLGANLTFLSWNTLPCVLSGVGPERFFEVFTLYRPASVNLTPVWNIGFTANASLLLHVSCTLGVLGLISFLIFCIALWRDWLTHPVTSIQAILFILLAFFAPPTLILILVPVLFILSSDTTHEIQGEIKGSGRFLIAFFLLLITLISLYGILRWHKGERLLFQSLKASDEGNGTQTFMLQEEAVKTNPMNPSFHLALSQTSLLLAENLVRSSPVDTNNKPNLSPDEKTLLTNLISRSIQEAKLGITLSPANVHTWVALGRVYQGLIGVANQSDTWAIAAYQKAITLDPTNPVLRLDLGGLYMSLGKYEDAGKEFITALILKPNYIDALYNLANAFRQKGDFDNAVKALGETKKLLTKGSTDETKIQEEILSVLEEKKTKGSTTQPTSLYVPELKLPDQ